MRRERNSADLRLTISVLVLAALIFALSIQTAKSGDLGPQRHLALNLKGDFSGLVETGFDLADVSSVSALDKLPDGLRGVLWLGNGYNTECVWRVSDAEVRTAVRAAGVHPKFSGIYYISDEPHPSVCPDAPQRVAERTALIHSLDPNARTFIIVENSSRDATEFVKMRGSADLIGVDPYPCNIHNAETGCNLGALRQRIQAALSAGIEPERIVPVYQAFGQSCTTREDPYYRLPSVREMRAMLQVWDELVPRDRRAFDVTYSWGVQPKTACPVLKMADGDKHHGLLRLFKSYFMQAHEGGGL